MRILGLNISRASTEEKALSAVDNRDGWFGLIRESFTGAWQSNVEVKIETALSHSAVFRCIGLISADIAKMRVHLISEDKDGIWNRIEKKPYTDVLKKPNRYQNRIQFYSSWVQSKLIHGNTYALKQRDNRGRVIALYILGPGDVTPLVADNGDVYYRLGEDNLSGLEESSVTVPSSEIIHDRMNTLYHPLVGLSPLYAGGLAAAQGLSIQNNSTNFFTNGSRPGGVLSAPGAIGDDTAKRLKDHWDANYTGKNNGKVAVLGDGLEFKPMAMSAVDAQLIDQLKWSAETVCSVFGVPAFKIGVGEPPTYANIESLDQQYYSQCLQIHIESLELSLDEGLDLKHPLRTEFDLDQLLRMDTESLVKTEKEAVSGGIKAPNESRKRLNLAPVEGGEAPYLQQQNYSLAALAKRDAAEAPVELNPDIIEEDQSRALLDQIQKGFA